MKTLVTSFVGLVAMLSIATAEEKAAKTDIVDTAVAAGSFKTLVAAVKAAGLVEALKAAGPLTVFAPTDEAFAKLPAGTVESLLKPENKEKLVDILTYHVVNGNVPSKTAVTLDKATALNKRKSNSPLCRESDLEWQRQGDQSGHRMQQWRDPRHRYRDHASRQVI